MHRPSALAAGTRVSRSLIPIVAILALALSPSVGPRTAQAAPGDLDAAFGTGGKQLVGLPSNVTGGTAAELAVAPDGRIWQVIQAATADGRQRILVMTYDGTGQPIAASGPFAPAALVDIPGGGAAINDMAFLPDGKLVLAGDFTPTGAPAGSHLTARLTPSGMLDNAAGTGFGSEGYVIAPVPVGAIWSVAYGVAVQYDKIVVAGVMASTVAGNQIFVARYNANGSLDTSFGDSGYRIIGAASQGDESASDVAVLPDGRILVAGGADRGGQGDVILARLTEDGALDTTFGSGGVAEHDLTGGPEGILAMSRAANGKIVLAGYRGVNGATSSDALVARFNGDGSRDTSFDGDGWRAFDGLGSADWAEDVAVLADGKVAVSVRSQASIAEGGAPGQDFLLNVFRPDGTPDTAYGTAGRTRVDFAAGFDNLWAMDVQADGRILQSGESFVAATNSSAWSVARLLAPDLDSDADGTADATDADDDNDGVADTGDNCPIAANADQADGDHDGIGDACELDSDADGVMNDSDNCPFRYNPNQQNADGDPAGDACDLGPGELDRRFLTGGTQVADYPTGAQNADISELALAPDGMIWQFGRMRISGSALRLAAARYAAVDGSPLPGTEAGSPVLLRPMTGGEPLVNDAVFQADGRAVIVGGFWPTGSPYGDLLVARLTAEGDFDTSFGTNGVTVVPRSNVSQFGISEFTARGVALQGEKIIVTGYLAMDNGYDNQIFVARFGANGQLDTSFGSSGRRIFGQTGVHDMPAAVAVLPDGRLLIAGVGSRGGQYNTLLARLDPNGNLDASFGSGGIVEHDLVGRSEDIQAMSVAPDGKIVVVGSRSAAAAAPGETTQDVLVARFLANGSLDTTFSTDGWLAFDGLGFTDAARDVEVLLDGKVAVTAAIAGVEGASSDFNLYVFQADGSVDTSFGVNGRVRTPFYRAGEAGNENVRAMAVQRDGKVVLAGTSNYFPTGGVRLSLARYMPLAMDADADSDGLSDLAEQQVYHSNPNEIDSDSDGLFDGEEAMRTWTDPADSDTDGDSVNDAADDSDGDGLSNIDERHVQHSNALVQDTDGDGVNDGLDALPLDPNESADTDADGWGDNGDNCPTVANPDQADADHDGIGDACEDDGSIRVNSTAGTKSTASDGVCTLREAIEAANRDAAYGGCNAGKGDDDVIELIAHLPGNTPYVLTEADTAGNGLPVITGGLTLRGHGAVIQRSAAVGTPEFRLVAIATTGRLTLEGAALIGGQAPVGGALYLAAGGALTLANSTLSGNTATEGAAIGGAGAVTLRSSTIAGSVFGETGGNLAVTASRSILTAACAGSAHATSEGYNVAFDTSCGLTSATDRVAEPMLAQLVGGVHALLPGSPALDMVPVGAGLCGADGDADQRGVARPRGGACDAGAYEVDDPTFVDTSSAAAPAGGTVTTDAEADGASPTDPVETSVSTPVQGTVSITESTAGDEVPEGFLLLGQSVEINAPAASAEDPLALVFVFDASILPSGTEPGTVTILRNGVGVADCSGPAGTAAPDPCVASRATLADGDIELRVLTSRASTWTPVLVNLSFQQVFRIAGQADEDYLGESIGTVAVSADGNTAIVGAPGVDSPTADPDNQDNQDGAAYVLVRENGVWRQQAKIAGDAADHRLGRKVALSGDGNTALIAQDYENPAYIYGRQGTSWTRQASLTGDEYAYIDRFGSSIALSADGNTALIGAPYDDAGAPDGGAAYVFVRSGSTWVRLTKLTGNFYNGALRGVAVSADGRTAALGTSNDGEGNGGPAGAGAVHVFVRDDHGTPAVSTDDTWARQVKLLGGYSEHLGSAIALSADGGLLASTAPFAAGYGTAKVYVYTRAGTNWARRDVIDADAADSGVQPSDAYNVGLSGDGKVLAIGARNGHSPTAQYAGSVRTFVRRNGLWEQRPTLYGEQADDGFGVAIALNSTGTTLMAGAQFSERAYTAAAYMFERADDGDRDGVISTSDNCPLVPNPLQEDEDGDGKGDVCDGVVPIVVESTAGTKSPIDDDACTLREAIEAANRDQEYGGCSAGNGADTIVLGVGETYTLTEVDNSNGSVGRNGLPVIVGSVRIVGNGSTIRRADSVLAFRLIYVGATARLEASDVALVAGRGSYGGGIYTPGGTVKLTNSALNGSVVTVRGGGIYASNSTVTLANSTLSGNIANDRGGGIYAYNSTVTLTNSALSSNYALSGGGGINAHLGTVTLSSSTLSSNSASGSVGGGGGIHANGTQVTLANSTLSSNTASTGGGIYSFNGTVTLKATILDNVLDCVGAVHSLGFNVYRGSGCAGFGATDVKITTPALAPLADNGGPTLTHALLPGTPLMDRIPAGSAGCGDDPAAKDQRGQPRLTGAGCDVGAVEVAETAVVGIAVAGGGSGTVVSEPAGVNCPGNCNLTVALGTRVTLRATPGPSSTFIGWSGDCTSSGVVHAMTVAGAKSCTATFSAVGAIAVTTTENAVNGSDGKCSLREAIVAANTNARSGAAAGECTAGASGVEDVIDLPAGQYVLAAEDNATDGPNGLPSITSSITLRGAGATIRRDAAAPAFRIVHVGADGSLKLSGVNVTGGNTTGDGGGVYVAGSLLLERSTVYGNTANRGGGVAYAPSAPASAPWPGGQPLLINDSTISGNSAASGGGVFHNAATGMFVFDSSIVSNTGGGLAVVPAVAPPANGGDTQLSFGAANILGPQLTGSNCSPSGNSGSVRLTTPMALDSDGTCNGPGDLSLIDPLIGPLSDNGGLTLTHGLLPGSPAIDAMPAPCGATDQRGVARPQGSGCDIGAFEVSETFSEQASGLVPAGGTVTTDATGDGPGASDPVEASVTAPSGGSITIEENVAQGVVTDGVEVLGQVINIDAPVASAAEPLVIVLQLAAALVPAGETEQSITIYRNGVAAAACAGPVGQASPDPCVASRERLADGDLRFTVLSSHASDWSLGLAKPIANAGGPYVVPEGGSAALSAAASVGGDGQAASIVGYAWDLDGDRVFGETGADAALGDETGSAPTYQATDLLAGASVIVALRVTDTLGRLDEAEAQITASSVPPQIAGVTNDGPVAPGSPATITIAATDPVGDVGQLRYELDCDDDGAYEVGPQPGSSGSCTYTTRGDHRVGVRVKDAGDGAAVGSTVVVVNTPPVARLAETQMFVDEGGALNLVGSARDVDGDPTSLTWDLDNDGTFETAGATATYSAAQRDGPGRQRVCLKASDGISTDDVSCGSIDVGNLPPTAVLSAPAAVERNAVFPATLSGATDPGAADRAAGFRYSFDCGGGNGFGTPSTSATGYCTAGAPNGGSLTVRGRVIDKDGGAREYSVTVSIVSNAPVVDSINAPVAPVLVNTPVSASASFQDSSAVDQHRALWAWGDGATTTQPNVTSPVSASHTYGEPGVYTISLTITDAAGASHSATSHYIVVFDPNGGFVTGGGWINSPAGALVAQPTLTGKATFGFVAKYKQGKTVPEGNTEFQFKAGNLNFKSTGDYMWLTVSGSGHKATYRGTGKINGAGNYGVMVVAIDEANTPSTDVDLFRIKIWDKSNGDAVVYDNQLGTSCGTGDDADPCTAIGGGDIKIHKN